MSINNDGVETESFQTFAVNFHVVLKRRWLRLAKTVDVENGAQVVQLVVSSKVESFPDGSFSTLTIPNQAVSSS